MGWIRRHPKDPVTQHTNPANARPDRASAVEGPNHPATGERRWSKYIVAYCATSWHDPNALAYANRQCQHNHRTVRTAVRCDELNFQRPVRRANPGSQCWLDTRILAVDDDGNWRFLTNHEMVQQTVAIDEMEGY